MSASLAPVPEIKPAGPQERQRSVRVPQLIGSLLVVAVFALLAVWWQARSTDRQPALALANDVEVGVPLTRADLTEIYISTDVPAAYESPEFVDFFVGVRPVTDLPAGTILTDNLFRTATELKPNEAMVGLRVTADEAPPGLTSGDRVQVLLPSGSGGPVVLAPDAKVESAVPSRDASSVVLKLRMGVEQAQQVQVASEQVVVIEIDAEGPASWESGGTHTADTEAGGS